MRRRASALVVVLIILAALLVILAAAAAIGWLIMGISSSANAEQKPPREEFAADRAPAAAAPVPFDAKRAMGYLEAVCKIGPRISGSEGMKKQQELLKKHFESHGAKVELQSFPARQVSQKKPVEMANLIAVWNPEAQRRVILCAHYDTRPIADQERDRDKWYGRFVGANDGGSGVALLMELAHHMKELKPQVGVDFVLFDGEEYIFDPPNDKYFFGSEHFAQQSRNAKHRYAAAILLDMVAGKDARFPYEGNSVFLAGKLLEQVWDIAGELKCGRFQKKVGHEVLDDHLALNRAGIPAIDIIDFDYPHWHRLSDTPENCSGETMAEVAKVVSVWLQRVK
jgi:glutaminyl-peptide cyclotransferase